MDEWRMETGPADGACRERVDVAGRGAAGAHLALGQRHLRRRGPQVEEQGSGECCCVCSVARIVACCHTGSGGKLRSTHIPCAEPCTG
jgi:hypothetical protein